MNSRLLLTAAALTGFGFLNAQDPAAKAAPAEAEKPFPVAILEQALNNMGRIGGYHVEAVIEIGGGKATLSGDLGVGTLSFKGDDGRGNKKLRILADKQFFLSTDGGATWKTGADADKQSTIFLSNIVTGPVEPSLKVWEKGEFKAEEEKVDGEDLLHVSKEAKGKEPAAHFWIVREPKLDNAVFIRKASVTIAADDGDFPITVTYTKLNEPGEIKAPVVK